MPAFGLPLEHQAGAKAHFADHLFADDHAAAEGAQELGRVAQLSVAAFVADLEDSFYFILMIYHDQSPPMTAAAGSSAASNHLWNSYESPVSHSAWVACGFFTWVGRGTTVNPTASCLLCPLALPSGRPDVKSYGRNDRIPHDWSMASAAASRDRRANARAAESGSSRSNHVIVGSIAG